VVSTKVKEKEREGGENRREEIFAWGGKKKDTEDSEAGEKMEVRGNGGSDLRRRRVRSARTRKGKKRSIVGGTRGKTKY